MSHFQWHFGPGVQVSLRCLTEGDFFEALCQELEATGLSYAQVAEQYQIIRALAKDLHKRYQLDTQYLVQRVNSVMALRRIG